MHETPWRTIISDVDLVDVDNRDRFRLHRAAPRHSAFRGQRNYCGFWWFTRTKRHLTFESWCARGNLIALVFDPSVRGVAEQPFTMRFAAVEGGQREHTPDFFVRSVTGEAIVVDVRPQAVIDVSDREKFGWEYRQVGELPSPWIANVRWLAGYRHERAHPLRSR
jgi:hypothetical protein